MKTGLLFSVLLVLMNKDSNSAVVTSPAAELRSCPSSCECSMREVRCSDKQLSDIPNIELRGDIVVTLDVSDNNIELLSNNTFKQFPDLKNIDISKNQITSIELGAFHGIDNVQGVDLSENIIMFIDPDTFSENPNLEMVNLSGNQLMMLSTNVPILNAPMITTLDISFCQITSLTPEMLKGMTKLHSLDIKNNDITHFAYENLIFLDSLVELKLENNEWICGDCNILNVLRVMILRNPDGSDVHEQVTCLDKSGSSRVMSVLKEVQYCNGEVNDSDVIVTEGKQIPGYFDHGLPFHRQLHTFSLHTIVIVGIALAIIIICIALCTTIVIKRILTQDDDSCNDRSQMKNRNLMLAFAEPQNKRASLEPLLTFGSTTECTMTGAGPASLYHDYTMNRPNSEHLYSTIE